MAKGKLIAIEGLDGSGKATQTALLYDVIRQGGQAVRRVSFPDYTSKSSTLVRMYLDGEIGGIGDVNLYAASSFYACDRYISYAADWGRDYEAGSLILCDRYTTSNIPYQMSKLPGSRWDEYMDWLWDYEFSKLGLPAPDLVVYLDMAPETSRALLDKRYGGDEDKRDIHERDLEFLLSCRKAALYAAGRLGWHIIKCCDGQAPLPVEAVAKEVGEVFNSCLK